MNNLRKNNLKSQMQALALTGAIILTGCGGGGGGSAASPTAESTPPTPAPEPAPTPAAPESPGADFEPGADRLETAAAVSRELYVEPAFDFDLARTVNFYFTVSGNDNAPIVDTLLKVYAVPENTENWDELRRDDKQLLFIGKTDSNGTVDLKLELSPTIKQVLAVVANVGIDNQALVAIEYDAVSHHF